MWYLHWWGPENRYKYRIMFSFQLTSAFGSSNRRTCQPSLSQRQVSHYFCFSCSWKKNQTCFKITTPPDIEEQAKTESCTSEWKPSKDKTSRRHHRQHVHLRMKYISLKVLLLRLTWLAISSSMAASASNQRTGRKTSGSFSKKSPMLGFGRSWMIICSRISTWQGIH